MDFIYDGLAWALPVLLAVTLHEAAHGWMAERFGDDTARRMGRVSFNPLRHIDKVGTVLMPGLLVLAGAPFVFGYAKPVPVDFARLQPRRAGLFMVAVAGVLMNLALAYASALLLHLEPALSPEQAPYLYKGIYRSIGINLALIVFNLIPLLPLDGGRAVAALLPTAAQRAWAKTERFGLALVLLLVVVPPMLGYTFLLDALEPPFDMLRQGLLAGAGIGV